MDDGIFCSKDNTLINETIGKLTNIKEAKKSLNIDDQGDIADYLGLNFEKLESGKIKISQPHLVQQITDEVGLTPKSYTKTVPAAPTKLLSRDPEQAREQEPFDYRRVIGKLNFLEKSSRPDLAYAVHQCARFSSDPREEHYDTVRYIARYLLDTKNERLIFDPKMKDSLSVWVDADFSGNWNRENVDVDESTAKSRTGYVIMLAGCPIHWKSKLQSQVALSSCEAEYISLSQSMRDAIPIMNLIQEIQYFGFMEGPMKTEVKCTVFEDNGGAVESAKVPKIRPRTKHINLVYHHFRSFVKEGKVKIIQVRSGNQLADIMTKPLCRNLFQKFRKKILGW